MLIYRLPDTVDRQGNTWAFWPWILSNRAEVWERFGTEDEAIERMKQMNEEDENEEFSDGGRPFNTFRDGKVHVLSEECATCIFRPHTRPVPGARVAELVRNTKDEEGATVVCHSTIYREDPQENAICRGWYDRLGDQDNLITMAQRLGIIEEQEPPVSRN